MTEDVEPALQALRKHTNLKPELALVLGSGLGELAETATQATVVPARELPGYPEGTVSGHKGQLVFGKLEGRAVVFVQGRLHYYEGYPVRDLTFPIRLVHAAGARRLMVTNAAGGIHGDLTPGTLMFISDHLNMAMAGPLFDPVPGQPVRAGDRMPPYDRDWLETAERVASERGILTRRGTYVWTQGPSYETKAEINAFRRMGGDAVGMSTVPEVLQARHLGMDVLGLSTITNPAAGLNAEPLSHQEVLEVGRRVRRELERLVRGIVKEA